LGSYATVKKQPLSIEKAVKLSLVAKTIGRPQNLGPEATDSFDSPNIYHCLAIFDYFFLNEEAYNIQECTA